MPGKLPQSLEKLRFVDFRLLECWNAGMLRYWDAWLLACSVSGLLAGCAGCWVAVLLGVAGMLGYGAVALLGVLLCCWDSEVLSCWALLEAAVMLCCWAAVLLEG